MTIMILSFSPSRFFSFILISRVASAKLPLCIAGRGDVSPERRFFTANFGNAARIGRLTTAFSSSVEVIVLRQNAMTATMIMPRTIPSAAPTAAGRFPEKEL